MSESTPSSASPAGAHPDGNALSPRVHWVNHALLWFMRVGIVAMIIATGAYLSLRGKPSAEQEELIRSSTDCCATSRCDRSRPASSSPMS